MARMSLETAIKLSAEVKGGGNIDRVKKSLQDLAKGSQTTAREMGTLRAATFQFARANDNTIAGIRSSIGAFRGLQEQAKIGSREFQRYGAEIQKLEGKLRGLDGTATAAGDSLGRRLAAGLASSLATIGAGRAIGGSLSAVVASEESERRLRSLSQGLDDYSRVQATATAAAQKFGTAQTQTNQEFAQIYARLRPIGLTLEEISTVYNGFNTAAKLSGTTSAEASAAFLQLSQALGTGVLRGEELNSVFEQTPAVVQGIAEVMGVPIGQIRELAKEGRITGDIVLTALGRIERNGAPKLAEAMKGPAQQFRNLQIAGQELQIEIGEALLPTALAMARAATQLLQEVNKLPEPVRNVGVAAAATGVAVVSLTTAMNAIGGIRAATAALNAYTASATASATASTAAATSAGRLLTVLGTLGKIGLITVGVKFAIEGLDELLTGLVGVQDAEAAAKAMAERRGLTYTPSAAVTRRNQASSAYVSRFSGARDAAFARAQQITGAPPPSAPAPAGGGGAKEAGAAAAKGVKELLRLTDAEIAAAVNTAIGEYGGPDPRGRTDVFANILARSRSGQFPSNLVDVVTQPGQYAPNFGRSRAQVVNPNLYGRSRFEQVKAELLNPELLSQSVQDVNSRLYFKGISQYGNMMSGDFLRAQGQNFFHGPGRQLGTNPQITAGLLRDLEGASGVVSFIDEQQQAAEKLKQAQDQLTEKIQESIKARTDSVVQLNKETELLKAASDEERIQIENAYEANNIKEQYRQLKAEALDLDKEAQRLGIENSLQEQTARLEAEERHALANLQLKTEQDLNKVYEERTRLFKEFMDQVAMPTAYNQLEQQRVVLDEILEKYPAIGGAADAAADLATRGLAEVVTGAKSAKEVFVDFLNGVASALLDAAKKMIAQYIAIGIARMFAGFTSSALGTSFQPSTTGPFQAPGSASAFSFNPGAMVGRAVGGPTMAGQPYKVGERGPELFVPYQSGTIIPAEATEALEALNNASLQALAVPFQRDVTTRGDNDLAVPFQRGMEGLTVPFQRDTTGGAAGDRVANGAIIDVRFETIRVGDLDVVTREEAQRIGRESAQRGAELAQKRLINNPTARRAVGMS